MKMALEDERQVMVKIQEICFYDPCDINRGTTIVNDKAYVEEMCAEEQQHYAEDGRMSPKEI